LQATIHTNILARVRSGAWVPRSRGGERTESDSARGSCLALRRVALALRWERRSHCHPFPALDSANSHPPGMNDQWKSESGVRVQFFLATAQTTMRKGL